MCSKEGEKAAEKAKTEAHPFAARALGNHDQFGGSGGMRRDLQPAGEWIRTGWHKRKREASVPKKITKLYIYIYWLLMR